MTIIKGLFYGLSMALLLGACSDNKTPSHQELDQRLQALIQQHALDKPFVADSTAESPLLADLGRLLFFSPDLSIDGASSCASCHHPTLAGADGVALPVGIGGVDSQNVGQQRIDAAQQATPNLDLQGFVPRNVPTVFNASLFRQNLFWDGRVQYQDDPQHPGQRKIMEGVFPAQHNPNNYLQENLLQTQARLPLNSNFEMKGAHVLNRNSHEVEQDILHFLQTQERWCLEFAKVFGLKPCNETITLTHLTQAITAFEASSVFTESPFRRYAKGDTTALTAQQKQGAITFLTSKEQGGAGCVNCHSGNTFSNEDFYNINIPPSGRGANDNGWDLGRHNVDRTAERFSFRVPILLNVALTGPYFHNGVALTLEDAIRFKQTHPGVEKPAKQLLLDQFDYATITAEIAADFEKSSAKPLLPEKLSEEQITNLAAFLHSLSDECLTNEDCVATLSPEIVQSPRDTRMDRTSESGAAADKPRQTRREPPKPPQLSCAKPAHRSETSADQAAFSRHVMDVGFDHQRRIGLVNKGWLIDVVNYASVAATDLNFDCLDDLVFDAGEQGLISYLQQPDGRFKRKDISYQKHDSAVNAIVMDLDGDYRYDLFVGSYGKSPSAFVFDFMARADDVASLTALTGPVINASAGDVNGDGKLDVVFGMWRSFSSFKQPHIWYGDGNGNLSATNGLIELRQSDRHVGGDEYIKRQTRMAIGESDLTFTPNLADIDGSGDQDLLLASDFFRSQVLRNKAGRLQDVTDKSVIDDSNGMGAAVGDYDNNGTPDWFVTSIVDHTMPGLSRGHRLYMNQGEGVFAQAPIVNKAVEWSWGACTADFNNDGHLDIFYISGYGEPMQTARYESDSQRMASEKFFQENARYTGTRPTLLINDGKGGFTDQSEQYGLADSLDGRGVACFDYQQDGDIDIVVAPVEGAPVLLRNNLGNKQHWIALRLIGLPPNTEAFGTKVEFHSEQATQYRQVRFENNYVSRNPAQLHVGLASGDTLKKVVITLPEPTARVVELTDLALDKLHVFYVADLLKGE